MFTAPMQEPPLILLPPLCLFQLTLCMNSLKIDMKVENPCKYFPCYFTVLRFAILKVKDVRQCEIYGLSTCKQISLLDTSSELQLINPDPGSEKITIQREYMDVSTCDNLLSGRLVKAKNIFVFLHILKAKKIAEST